MIKFHYFGDTSTSYTNVITAASSVSKNEDGTGTIKFGVAFSNCTDRYDKQMGKHLAITRLDSHPFTTTVEVISFFDICKAIANYINTEMEETPSWTKTIIGKYVD
jgi:hypothetical protein